MLGELEVLELPGKQQNRERLRGLRHSADRGADPSPEAGVSVPALSGLISERVAPAISAAVTLCGW